MVQMKIVKSIALLLTGIAIGALATSSISAAMAQQGGEASAPRLRFIGINTTVPAGGSLQFVSDAKTGACWLAGLGPNGNLSTLATAPDVACK